MNEQIGGGLADEKLYSRGAGGGQADDREEGNDSYSWQRRLNADKSIDSRTAQIKSATTTVVKKMAESEAKTALTSGIMWRAIIYYLGIPLLIMGGILLIFIFISIFSQSPPSSSSLESNIPGVPAPIK